MKMTYTDGTPEFEFAMIVPDMILWEKYARQQKITLIQTAPDFPRFMYTAFLSYAAARRMKLIPDTESFDDYAARCAMPAPSADDPTEESDTDTDPT